MATLATRMATQLPLRGPCVAKRCAYMARHAVASMSSPITCRARDKNTTAWPQCHGQLAMPRP
eukprot:3959457-Lingulodinium_polyedra.AAC.1